MGIETDRGLLVTSLVAAGYQVYAVNPRAVDRYRDRHAMSGAKSDGADAKLLADLVRTDRHNHRQVAGDSDLAEAVKVNARAHQNLVWTRQRQVNWECQPAALGVAGVLPIPGRAWRSSAPTWRTETPWRCWPRHRPLSWGGACRPGRSRRRCTAPAGPATSTSGPRRSATGCAPRSWPPPTSSPTLTVQIAELESALADRFEQLPDADILRSLPGLAIILGARVLGEFGDDPNRYVDAKARKNYAGSSPITKQSGRRKIALARFVRNRRLADAITWWAFCSLQASPGARAFYDRHRAAGDTHHKALRALSNRWVGILHGCLRHRTAYDEATAWGHLAENLATAA